MSDELVKRLRTMPVVWSREIHAAADLIEQQAARIAELEAASAQSSQQASEPFGWAPIGGSNYFTRNESSAKRIGGLVPVYLHPALSQATDSDESDRLSILLCEIRAACGDNGEREPDELVRYIAGMREAVQLIAEQEHMELMLDPTWAQRIAIGALSQHHDKP